MKKIILLLLLFVFLLSYCGCKEYPLPEDKIRVQATKGITATKEIFKSDLVYSGKIDSISLLMEETWNAFPQYIITLDTGYRIFIVGNLRGTFEDSVWVYILENEAFIKRSNQFKLL